MEYDPTRVLPKKEIRYGEDIFTTAEGTYQFNKEKGLFLRTPGSSTPMVFVGSFEPRTEVKVDGQLVSLECLDPAKRAAAVLENLLQRRGILFGFSSHLRVGYFPFGVACTPQDILYVRPREVSFSDGLIERLTGEPGVEIELGSRIEAVYRELGSAERKYQVYGWGTVGTGSGDLRSEHQKK